MNAKTLLTMLAASLLLVGCAHHYNDATLQKRVTGTWTTKDINAPGQIRFSEIKLVLGPGGRYYSEYTINHPDGSEQAETLTGTWYIEHGIFLENLTNSAGKAAQPNGGSKILKVSDNHFVISNWTSPHRVFTRTQ